MMSLYSTHANSCLVLQTISPYSESLNQTVLFSQRSFSTKQPSYKVNSDARRQSFKINLEVEMSQHDESITVSTACIRPRETRVHVFEGL